MENLTPRQIVAELDKHIVGQKAAKRGGRDRAAQPLAPPAARRPALAEEIVPKNILMIGPTGVGKTEIARRLAKLVERAVHQGRGDEVHRGRLRGRDVESMVRDLVELGIEDGARRRCARRCARMRRARAEERLLAPARPAAPSRAAARSAPKAAQRPPTSCKSTREKFRDLLRTGELEERTVEIEVDEPSAPPASRCSPRRASRRWASTSRTCCPASSAPQAESRSRCAEAREVLLQQEAEKLIDRDKVTAEARRRVEQSGIVFLDEIDKIAGREARRRGPDVSREGVQRDLLPIVEGTTVTTKHGPVQDRPHPLHRAPAPST